MTSVAPAGEGVGGAATSSATAPATTTTTSEQAPSPAAAHQQSTTQPPPPQQHPPPSPLSGCYLLVVLPEPHTAQHKDLILNRLAKGFLSWDKDSCHVDLEKELQALVAQSPEGEEARNGERLIQYATENLVTEVLIYPQSNTLLQCIRNLLASFTKHRHIIHAGYTFGGNGSWILQDGTFSLADFLDAFSEHEVQRVLRAYENSVTVDIHCAGVGDWTTSRLSKEACTRACRVRVNPDDVLTAGVPAITSFVGYIGQYLIPQTLDQLMEPSDVVGNIRFSHPTLYVFPGGQGDAALFGINGFNMLVDGGFARKACFWDFVRHLDRLDAVLVTRINNSNVGGMSSVIRKKKEMHVYPQIGHFFCNLVERKHSNSPDGDKDIDPLIFNLIDAGQEMMVNLRHINLRPHPCYRDPEPINLYHKVGHGTLDMYVLSPSKDSREVREFMAKWNASDSKLFAGSHRKDSNSILFPVQNLVSICALLVWQPANPEDTITRILFPGSTPQHKIFEGFERLKHLEFLKRPVCTAKSLSPSTSLATLKEKAAILKPKLGSIERETKKLAEMRKEKRDLSENKAVKKDTGIDDATAKIIAPKPAPAPIQQKTESKAKKVVENKKIESESKESKMIENGMKEIKKEVKKIEKSEETKKTDLVKVETEKTAPVKELKTQKVESKKKEAKEATKPIAKPTRPDSTIKTTTKPTLEKKSKPAGEKKDIMKPSPTTPKKSINGAATKTEMTKNVTKSVKVTSKTTSTVPAKSAKDANNRMVVEQKNIELSSKSAADSKGKSKTTTTTPSAATTERKPVTRRQPKPLSPSKARLSISPSKSAKSTPSSIKSEKDAVIRKIKSGTTDSSAVSTPSGIDIEAGHKLIDRNLTEKSEDMSLDSIESKVLADLKEEREVVEEIEAVLQKAERIEGTRKQFERDEELATETVDKKDEDATEEDVTAEMDDVPKKISRKESQELTEEDEYLIVEKEEIFTEDSVQSGDTEQKHHLDEVESEKTRIHIEHPAEESEHDEEKDVDEKMDETPEKKLVEPSTAGKEAKKSIDLSPENKEILEEEMKQIIASATEAIQKTEEKDDSARKDSEDITKEPSSTSPEKFDSPGKQDTDQKESIPEKLEESQERISTLESGATTTAPTLPDDERVPLDEIKEELEKHVSEEVKEKELVKEKEILPEMPAIVPKPEVKILDVKPPLQGIARDIVKTPDEVADLPVHEEVDPKLYRMDDLEKEKDVKISPQDTKESPTPPKDKGVFSFFGKVADTFEKGIDKLTKKGRRDSHKENADDKSSKSSSPKETRPQDQMLLEDIDINKVFPKVGKHEEALDSLVKAKQEIRDAISDIDATTALLQEDIKDAKTHEFGLREPHHIEKHAEVLEKEMPLAEVKQEVRDAIGAIDATTAFLQADIKDAKSHESGIIEPHHIDKHAEVLKKEISLVEAKQEIRDAISGIDATTALLQKDMEDAKTHEFGLNEPHHIDKHEEVVEDIQEVEALMEEASKKFKHVKDSLQDSLESLEDKIDEVKKAAMEENDSVKDVLAGVAEKLEDIADIKEPEKVKFSIPESEEFEADDEDSGGIVRDFKEAVRDVAEVLVGTAGIEIEKEEKPKDVEGIVKKVAEVLKEDDFLSEKTLLKFTPADEAKTVVEETARDVKDQVEEFIRNESIEVSPQPRKMSDVHDAAIEEPFTKTIKSKEFVSSPVKDDLTGLEEAKILCEDMLKDDCIRESIITEQQADTRPDVMDVGLEEVCVKKVAKRDIFEEKEEDDGDKIIIEPEIGFQQNLSPGKAELVTVTPGSTPTSPKLATEAEFSDISPEYKDMINKETNLENIIEEFIVKRKHKITLNIIEYIVIVKRVPKEKVINVIQEIIIKHKIPRESVADRVEILRLNDDIPTEKRTQIESDITKEYLNKNKKINSSLVDEIAKNNRIPKRIVIEIIEEIIVRKKFPRESVFDISEESYFTILKEDLEKVPEGEVEKQDFLVDVSSTIDSIGASGKSGIDMPQSAEEVDDKIVDGFVSISSKDEVEAFLLQKKESLQHDDFEAVEQEYKVKHDSTLSPKKSADDQKPKATEEVSENVADLMDTDEKFVRETAEKSTKKDDVSDEKDGQIKHAKKEEEDPSHDVDVSELSEADAKEKYLDEAKEKTSDHHVEPLNDEKDTQESATSVKRMVVTASSEDGGQETEICPSGTITFTKTISSVTEKTDEVKTTLIDKLQTHEIPVSIPHALDTAHSPDSLQSEDASPAESVFSKSPIEKTSPTKFESVQIEETSVSDVNEKVFHITEKISVTESIVEEGKLVGESHSTFTVEDVTTDNLKSPSLEKETSVKSADVGQVQHETEFKGEETSPKKSTATDHVHVSAEDKEKSKSPSTDTQLHPQEASSVMPTDTDHAHHEAEVKDGSKSPSTEKKIDLTEEPTKKLDDVEHVHIESEVKYKSKSPSVEKEVYTKESSSEKSTDADHKHDEIEVDGRSKSPSQEKEMHSKGLSPAKPTDAGHLETDVKDRSKSPSQEKEIHPKEPLPEKSTGPDNLETEVKDRSKSPSVEKEIHLKESSPKKSTPADHKHDEIEVKGRSKSPSQEKEMHSKEPSPAKPTDAGHFEAEVKDRSKSPSQEKEIHPKEPSPEKSTGADHLETEVKDRSKSPSVEKEKQSKEASPEKSTDADHKYGELEVKDRSKSPSQEKEMHSKEPSPEKSTDADHLEAEVKDRSKSPSQEKEIHPKEPSPEKSSGVDHLEMHSKKPSPTKPTDAGHLEADVKDRSKSPSQEKEIHPKEPSPEKSTGADHHETEIKDKSKSPSVDKEVHPKESSSEKSADADDKHDKIEVESRSKSPSQEKEMHSKEPSNAKPTDAGHLEADVKERSKSPSQEKEMHPKESSREESLDADHVRLEDEVKDKSKSPSAEKVLHASEAFPEKHTTELDHLEADVKDESKSPSQEKVIPAKVESTDADHSHSEPGVKGESISSSAEEEIHPKVSSPEKSTGAIHGKVDIKDGSKSPSVEKETHPKESTPEKSLVGDDKHDEIEVIKRSKSPSVEKEIKSKESTPEKSTGADQIHGEAEVMDKSKSPSAEKEVHLKEPSTEKATTDAEHKHAEIEVESTPSAEKEVHPNATSIDAGHIQLDNEIKDRSEAPSLEKVIHTKEGSPEKTSDADPAHHEPEVKYGSKSPSADKEIHPKELSPEQTTGADHLETEVKGRSKSPSVEKEIHGKEGSPEKITDTDPAHHGAEVKYGSKSPSAEKETHGKEGSPEKFIDTDPAHHGAEVKGKSKSPSVEKEIHRKEGSPEKITDIDPAHHEAEGKGRSKSPSVEKEIHGKEGSPEKITDTDPAHHEVEGKGRSKSPSVEKEIHGKEGSPEKITDTDSAHHEAEVKGRSKSPSVEKEIHGKESSPEKITDTDPTHHGAEVKDGSKSPSVEKEIHGKERSPEKITDIDPAHHEDEVKDGSKSPSAEKEIHPKDPSPEKSTSADHKHDEIEVEGKSKSPSQEKEMHSKEPSPEKHTGVDHLGTEVKDRSKSPSVEKEIHHKVPPLEKSTDGDQVHLEPEIKDRSKSPSAEKEVHTKKESIGADHAYSDPGVKDGPKSPSAEKEIHFKESSPEKSTGADHGHPESKVEDRSKSPSAENEIHTKEVHTEKLVVTDHVHLEAKVGDRSKSPSAEREMKPKDAVTDHAHDETEIKDTSKSPSVEEYKPEKFVDASHIKSHEIEVEDRSKSPEIEKETSKMESVPDKFVEPVDATKKEVDVDDTKKEVDAIDQSKSPSIEKEINVKQDIIDFIHFEKVQYSAGDTMSDKTKSPTSEKAFSSEKFPSTKLPSPEQELSKKESAPEKGTEDRKHSTVEITSQITERSRSSSISTESHKKEIVTEKNIDSEELKLQAPVGAPDEKKEKSKSPSVERDVSHHEELPGKSETSRKDSLLKKDVDDTKQILSDAALSHLEDISRSSSIIADITKDSDPSSKSRSGSIQSVIDHGISSLTSEKDKLKDAKSRTGSISESITSETRVHGSKSPSPEKVDVVSEQFSDTFMEKARLSLVSDKFDEDSLDRTKSPSVLSDKSDEKDIIDRSKSPSVVGDKYDIGQTEDSIKEKFIEDKPVSPNLSGPHAADKHESDKSKSVSPVGEKIHSEATGDRKASVTSIGSHAEDKGKDRSRSHSLFDTGDKTPLVRSRAASLYDEKLVEKVSLLEHGKQDSTRHSKDIFEEESEFRSSQETLGDIHTDIPRRDSKESDSLNAETKQAIENYILNEYIHKNKVITLACINEVTAIYKVDRYVVIKIVNELITNLKLKQEKLVEVDEDEHDEENQKLIDIEENLMNYINEEFVSKKKKINSNTIDDIASSKSVPRPLVILVIENIILSRNLPRESVVDFDLSESQNILQKDMGAGDFANKPSGKPRTEKMPEKVFVEDTLYKSKSPSPSPEIGSSSAAARSEHRPEPPMDEEIIISESKREEIESLIIDDYVNRGIKINEAILENIIARTAVPKYIIIEIIQEIIVKKVLSRNVVADEIIFSDDDLDDTPQKLEYGEPSHSEQYDEHRLDKSMPYSEYESPFHKAFMEGMTEIRTTHITTLSGKSTPDFGQREGTPESSEVTSTITRTITSIPAEYDQEDDAQDRIVILKTTQITTYPEDDQKMIGELVQNLPGPSEMQKIEEEPESRTGLQELASTTEIPSSITSKIQHGESEHEITEIVTTKIVKTIITETEMDPITKITRIISETPSETTTTTTHSKFTTDSKSSQETSIPATLSESHQSSTSKTVVTSSILDSGKSTPDIKHEEQVRKSLTGKDLMEHTVAEQMEQSVSPVIRDLISDDRSYSGKSSPDVSLPKDIAYGDSTGKSTPELSMSPLIRDGTMVQSHFSGRSTPDRRSDNRSRTATPEGFRSGEVIRTIITTTRTISDDGDLITTTQEVTETTNERGETVVLTKKTDVKVDEAPPDSLLGEVKSADAPRTSSPGSEKDKDPTSPRSDLSSGHSRAPTHMWESSEERHTYSDEDPSSPLFSSSPHHPDPRSSMKEEASKALADFSSSAMSSSFYGQLPEEVAQFTSTITKITESHPEQDFTFRKLTVEKEYAGGYTEKDSKKYIDDADLDFEKALTASVASSSSKELAKSGESKSGDADDKKDPLAGWGSPLKLPSPKAPRKFNLRSPIQPTSSADLSPDSLNFDVINDWGEPMRLPSPAPTNANELSNKGSPGTPKKERDQARKVLSENAKNKQRSQSPSKQDKKYKNAKNKVQPVYVDLTYVSHHGNSFYTALDFFKKIRARYYVFSGTEPSREVYDALLEAKKTWEDKDLEVTLIPTYDTDTLGYWVADNEEALAANHIDLSPSASRCTINLQDHETSCSAYRLEF